mgnify:CR=1 FL=1
MSNGKLKKGEKGEKGESSIELPFYYFIIDIVLFSFETTFNHMIIFVENKESMEL